MNSTLLLNKCISNKHCNVNYRAMAYWKFVQQYSNMNQLFINASQGPEETIYRHVCKVHGGSSKQLRADGCGWTGQCGLLLKQSVIIIIQKVFQITFCFPTPHNFRPRWNIGGTWKMSNMTPQIVVLMEKIHLWHHKLWCQWQKFTFDTTKCGVEGKFW